MRRCKRRLRIRKRHLRLRKWRLRRRKRRLESSSSFRTAVPRPSGVKSSRSYKSTLPECHARSMSLMRASPADPASLGSDVVFRTQVYFSCARRGSSTSSSASTSHTRAPAGRTVQPALANQSDLQGRTPPGVGEVIATYCDHFRKDWARLERTQHTLKGTYVLYLKRGS